MTDAMTIRDIKRLAETESTAVANRLLTILNNLQDKLTLCADNAAVKAIAAADRADKFLVYKKDTNQLFAFDAGSAAAEALGPPPTVIAPTAGTGRWLALSATAQPSTWFVTDQTDSPMGQAIPVTASGTFNNSNKMLRRVPVAGTLKVWYIGGGTVAGINDANPAVFKVIKTDNSALITKTFNTANQPGAPGSPTLIGTGAVVAGDVIGWEAILGATADLPAFALQFDITPA